MNQSAGAKPLRILAEALAGASWTGTPDLFQNVETISYDSRSVNDGSLFVALVGHASDGHDYLAEVAARGAVAAVVERPIAVDLPQLVVSDTRKALAHLAATFFDHPSRAMQVVGVTGTNGKTTTTALLRSIAEQAGLRVGSVGTVGWRHPGGQGRTRNTTPESLDLQRLLADMRDHDTDVVFLEVSSHATATHRILGTTFAVTAFINLSQDHLNFHGTMAAYFEAKRSLFDDAGPWATARPVINVSNSWGRQLREGLSSRRATITVATQGQADITADNVVLGPGGIAFEVAGGRFDGQHIRSPMIGRFNLENLLVAIGVASTLPGIGPDDVAFGLAAAPGAPGRMQLVRDPGPRSRNVIVDYAHSPEAIALAAASVRQAARAAREAATTIVVFGCGGDRDQSKRKAMGQAAAESADIIIATSDNPRGEDPRAIIDEQLAGAVAGGARPLERRPPLDTDEGPRYLAVVPRREAIGVGLALARGGDMVLVAGKGHEDYQEADGRRTPLSDVAEAREQLAQPAGRRVVETLPPAEIAALVCGELVREPLDPWGDDVWANQNRGVTTDTRQVQEGSWFVALVGERFDGHDFVKKALDAGACGVVVNRDRLDEAASLASPGRAVIAVDDTLTALGELARGLLRRHRQVRPWFVTVGITGSNGKTTTKELLAAVSQKWLRVAEHAILKTPGNWNNWIGLPRTVFDLRHGHDVAVLEMGTNAFGEIARLVEIAEPEVRVLTSVSAAHLEGFGSTNGVLTAKAELFSGPVKHTAIVPTSLRDRLNAVKALPAEESLVVQFAEGVSEAATSQATSADDDWVTVTTTVPSGTYELDVGLPLPGAHNRANLAAAVAAAAQIARRAGLDPGDDPVLSISTMHWRCQQDGCNSVPERAGLPTSPSSTTATMPTRRR